MTMGVRVVTATKPLTSSDRVQMKLLAADAPLAIKPTPYTAAKSDAVVFDSVPGSGFETSAMAAAIVPPVFSLTGTGAHLSISPAETNAFRAINAAWKANATVSRAGDRYVISGMSDIAQGELAGSLAINGERVASAGTALRKPRIALFEPPNSMDAGWTKWVLERYGFEFASINTPDITGNLRDQVRRASSSAMSGAAFFRRADSAVPQRRRHRRTMTRASRRSRRSCEAAARSSR